MMQSLKEQYPEDKGYRIARHDHFKFDCTQQESQIQISPANQSENCVIGMQPSTAKVLYALCECQKLLIFFNIVTFILIL